jgi:hypothetical protein
MKCVQDGVGVRRSAWTHDMSLIFSKEYNCIGWSTNSIEILTLRVGFCLNPGDSSIQFEDMYADDWYVVENSLNKE